MKKMIVLLACVTIMMSSSAFAHGTTAFTVKEGISFGMSEKELIATLGSDKYEIEKGIIVMNYNIDLIKTEQSTVYYLPADVTYVFIGDQLVAIHIDYDENLNAYDQVKRTITQICHDPVASEGQIPIPANGWSVIEATDDDQPIGTGNWEWVCWTDEQVAILLEKEEDGDLEVYLVDLDSQYFK